MKSIAFAISLFIVISWLVLNVYWYSKKSLSFVQNMIVYMVLSIFIMNYFTILSLQLKYIEFTSNKALFLSLLFERGIMSPISILFFVNLYLLSSTNLMKGLLTAAALIILTVFDYLMVTLGILSYPHWNYFYAMLINLVLLFVGLWLAKLTIVVKKWETQKNEGNL
ncbi:hypothetical protein [Alkalihalobacillus sp. AL-G]|uniref:hypothetical protein n=1 Tax=Alkalihalobacillus sp. AL-G TaxID=2926399 RepID=UPI00272DACDF|nr:hypothetical protein [Alkalihalobacillus sp. AL-G]WLD91624.1 hypothetical protein MOJ78_11255 [Alkalihalobacillus sp. AL-G]